MTTLVIGFCNDEVSLNFHSVGIRICYLLSNHLFLTGDLYMLFDIKAEYSNMKPDDKIDFIDKYIEEIADEQRGKLGEMAEAYRFLKKIKIKTKQEIVLLKKTESSLNIYFNIVLEEYAASFDSTGLPKLKDLVGKPGFGFYPVFYPDSENVNANHNAFSEILQLDLDKNQHESSVVFFLNCHFFSSEFLQVQKVIIPKDNKFTDNGFLTPLIRCNNFNLLGPADIDAIRNQVNPTLEKFQKAFDHFASLKTNPAEAFKYLRGDLAKAAVSLQAELDNTDMLKSYKQNKLFLMAKLQVYAGMLPWKTIYSYFTFTKTLQGETARIIEQAETPEGMMPVIILSMDTTPELKWSDLFKRKKTETNIAPLTVKKSLNL